MPRLLGRRLGLIAIALPLLAAAAVYWLFYNNGPAPAPAFPLDIAAIRAEASRLPGAGATTIEVETLSHQHVPRIAMEAGAEWAKVDMVRASYRLVWPHRTMILDTGYDEATARATGADSYDRSAWDRMQRALARCSLIAVTHEHGDHIGGLIASPELRDLLPQALLTPEQFRRIPGAKPQWPEDSRDGYIPMGYQGIMAIAPGVVLIRAAGHTPGSQMIYVRSASGHEYLFMGDTASLLSNVTHQHARSRLVTDFMTHDDRPAVLAQLAALHRLAAAEPGISLVPGHDADAIAALVRQGWLKRYFSLPPQR